MFAHSWHSHDDIALLNADVLKIGGRKGRTSCQPHLFICHTWRWTLTISV